MADDLSNNGDLLSQGDIDALIAAAMENQDQTVLGPDGRRFGSAKDLKIETYDFRNPIYLSEVELRHVRIRHEEFIRYLAARLSIFLRLEFGLKMSRLATLTYSKFIETIGNPAHIVLFKLEQLYGVGVLDFNPRLALTIVDRMLGGKGHSVKGDRYLTEIEMNLLEEVVQVILEEWCRQWKEEQELDASLIGRESNGRFLQTSPQDAIMLVLSMEATIGDCSETIQVAVPYYTLEPIIKTIHARRQREAFQSKVEKRPDWSDAYDSIRVPVTAEWDAMEVTVQELMQLRSGDVIRLPREVIRRTRVRLMNTTKFEGEVGLEGDRVVVRIGSRTTSEEES